MIRCQDVSPRLDSLAIVHMDQPADRLEESVIHNALIEASAPAKLGKALS